ncbi:MAG TPA: DHH family phosphoesterase [Spirochaetota bacterium]|nr:DHH family phosphoesterase [Spirochaetota bacterium]HPS85107.1 DHH family phosphoesterase [Spirochaetota bacterium]
MNNTEAFIQAVKKYKNIMIIISGSPDPDALASAHALKILLSSLTINSDIMITKKLSLSQNKAFAGYLSIPVSFKKKLSPEKYDAYIVPDFQTNIVEGISNFIPCAAHIDHHTKTDIKVPSDFSLIRTDAGSTSSLVALLIKDHLPVLDRKNLVSASTALMFGIQTDTDKYEHTTPIDIDALRYLSEYSDQKIINKINGIPISPSTMRYYKKAAENQHSYKDWKIYGIGYIDIEHRDSIAIVADLLLKEIDNQTVVVFALVEDKSRNDLFLDVSFRSRSENLDINALIKNITATGGGRQYKGAYQIKLEYFRACPDKNLLWETVEITTIDRLKKARDGIYISEISSFYSSVLKRAVSFFKK